MTGRAGSYWSFACAVLVCCGGRVSDEDEPRAPAGSGKSGAAGGNAPGQIDLAECDQGSDPNDANLTCPWLGSDDRCYRTKEAACACLCRENSGKTCSSGFPGGPDSRVLVSCF